MEIRQALTFDDVMLVPAVSEIMPGETDTRTRLTREIELGIPLVSAAMDTVTESALAIAMAQSGGIGVIHRNMTVAQQADEVRKVKKFEAGMVVNPVTIHPDETLAEALRLMADHKISGIPVVERGSGRLVGIITNRDVRFAEDPLEPVCELMTRDELITVRENVAREDAKRLLHQHRIEKLLVVDEAYRCVGLITVKDIEKAQRYPMACKDEHGRLRVAAATGTGTEGIERAEGLFAAGLDVLVVDTAHGHSDRVLRTVNDIRRLSNYTQVIAGNVATAEAARALVETGADAIKVGIGPGSICTTRMSLELACRNLPLWLIRSPNAAKAAFRSSPMAVSNFPAISPRRSLPVRIARCSALSSQVPTKARARSFCTRAAATSITAVWVR